MSTALAPRPAGIAVPASAPPHPAAVYLARLDTGSRRTMRQALDAIAALASHGQHTAATLPWQQLRYEHTQAIRAALVARYAPATTGKLLAALRGVLKECWRLGLLAAEDYHRAADLPGVKAAALPQGRALTSGELRALFAVCTDDPSPAGPRDAAVLACLYGAGLRRSEVVRLDAADVDPETGALTIRAGKGRKDRLCYVTNGGQEAVLAWLAVREPEPGPLFWPITKGGRLVPRRLTDQAVYVLTRKRGGQAGVALFSPHDLRRTFISDLLDADADIATVQKLAGHAGVQTTSRYDRRGEATKRKAATLLHVPYGRRLL